jgi:hypothetical protein
MASTTKCLTIDMKAIISTLFLAVPIYAFNWTICYMVFVGWNFRYFFKYLYLAWTSPGEIPSFIQIFSIGLTLLMCFLVFLKRKRLFRNKENIAAE